MKLISSQPHKTFHNHRAEPYFTYVKNGQKTIEGRIKKGWYQHVAADDHIIIYNEEESDSIEVVVKRVQTYQSIRQMLEHEQLKKVLPDADSIEHGVTIYQRFYSPEQEQRFGVVAIEIGKIS